VGLIFDYFANEDFLRYCFVESMDTFKEVVYILTYYLEIS